jgi:ABC-type sugar transport system substrate-binding protein
VSERVTLALVDGANQFQQLLREDAESAARRAGLSLTTLFTGDSFTDQIATLRGLVSDSAARPQAMVVMAVRDRGLDRVVREAAAAGIHCVFLNAIEDDLDPIRRQRPDVVVAVVCPDEVETGRIQGRQMRSLVPPGKRILYVQGNPRSLTSRQRTAGMQEAMGGAGIDVVLAGGDWSPEHAGQTVREWLRFAAGGRRPFELVTCQNDHMAEGALDALAAAAVESGRGELARIPVTGCDGAPDKGMKMVAQGRLAATVVLPRMAAPAVEVLARFFAGGDRPAPLIMHAATSFPPLDALRPTA